MKRASFLLIALTVISITSCTVSIDREQSDKTTFDYFQLKVFNYETEEQEALLDKHFQEAFLPALHRAGIKHVGVFKPIEGLAEQKDLIMVLIPFQSMEQFEQLPAQLMEDSEYQQMGKAYIDAAHDAAPYSRIESVILRSFSATPMMVLPELETPRSERVYELRSYEAATEKLYNLKVEMFNKGESKLFQDLKFNPVFFGEVLSSAHMPHLMYMTTHADTAAQAENWDAFRVAPEWERMKNLERYQNTVSSITKYLLYPTEYSDY